MLRSGLWEANPWLILFHWVYFYPSIALAVCLGALSCWAIANQMFSMTLHCGSKSALKIPKTLTRSPTPLTEMQRQTMTVSTVFFRWLQTFTVGPLSWQPPYILTRYEAKNFQFGSIPPSHLLPLSFSPVLVFWCNLTSLRELER